MPKLRWSMLPMAVLALALIALFPLITAAAPPQDAAAGQKTWDAKLCKSCHGPQGEGKLAAPLAGYPKTAADAIAQVRNPRQNMPKFSAQQVSDQEITDMVDYLKTLPRPASFTPVRYEAKADDPPGKVIFNQKRCVGCHGEDFSRTAGFVVQSGRTSLSEADVTKQLRTPRQNMPMFSETQVTADDIKALTPFLNAAVVKAAQGSAAAPAAPAAAATPAALPTTGGELPTLAMGLVGLLGLVSAGVGLALRRFRR